MQSGFNWNLFWNAFGAIGTTIGSMITAIAVVVAVKQYKQPLKKVIKVEVTSAIGGDLLGNPVPFYCISVKNKGIRMVQINSINVKGKKKVLWINNVQYDSNAKIALPAKIEPEECKDFLFRVDNFRKAINKAVNDKALRKNEKLIVFVKDSLGDEYFCKTNIKIKDLIENL